MDRVFEFNSNIFLDDRRFERARHCEIFWNSTPSTRICLFGPANCPSGRRRALAAARELIAPTQGRYKASAFRKMRRLWPGVFGVPHACAERNLIEGLREPEKRSTSAAAAVGGGGRRRAPVMVRDGGATPQSHQMDARKRSAALRSPQGSHPTSPQVRPRRHQSNFTNPTPHAGFHSRAAVAALRLSVARPGVYRVV